MCKKAFQSIIKTIAKPFVSPAPAPIQAAPVKAEPDPAATLANEKELGRKKAAKLAGRQSTLLAGKVDSAKQTLGQ